MQGTMRIDDNHRSWVECVLHVALSARSGPV
jgi:hypothetical protein